MQDQSLARLWAAVPGIGVAKLSGDGHWLFYEAEGLHEVTEIYALRTDGRASAERLTHSDDHVFLRGVNADGSRLIVAMSENACEHDRLWLLDRGQGNRMEPLTPAQQDHYVYGGTFLPDGQSFVFMADYDYQKGAVTAGGWLYRQDIASGRRQVLAETTSPFEYGPELSPSGRQILWHRHDLAPGGTQIWVVGSEGDLPREVLNLGDDAQISADWISETQIAFVADGPERDRVGVLDLSNGALRWLADEAGFCPQTLVAGAGGEFACLAYDHAQLRAVLIDGETGARRAFANPTGRGSLQPLQVFPNGDWLALAYDAGAPHQLVRLGADATVLTALTAPEGVRFCRPTDYRWTAPDGEKCQGWLYRPEGVSRGLVVAVHGGPTWHSEDWVNPRLGFLVQAGFTVLDPNYRGSTGFGLRWREAIKRDGWGGAEQDDIRAGIEALIADGFAEAGKIGVMGVSYGGYSSWVAITRFADLVNAAVPICGMYKLDIDYDATEMPHGRAYSEEMMGGRPDEVPERYFNASPGNFINEIKGDLLIVHGLADSNVGPENTHQAVRDLTAAGIAHEVLLFEREGHGVDRQSSQVTFFAALAAHFDRAFRKGK